MKKTKSLLFKLINQFNISKKCNIALKNAIEYDKKQIIIDQLFFNLNTEESIKLFHKIKLEFRSKMEIRREEALNVSNSISNYYGN